jgi:hypothetical protein
MPVSTYGIFTFTYIIFYSFRESAFLGTYGTGIILEAYDNDICKNEIFWVFLEEQGTFSINILNP